jgi:glutathione S-transferase
MLKLFYSPGACSLAPHIVIEWIGEPYEAARVTFGDPDYLKVNPAGAVPALDTGEGWTLTQAGAILAYLARRFPEAKLAGGDSPREKAEIDRWSHFLTGDLHPAFFPYFVPARYTMTTGPEAHESTRKAALKLVRKKLELLDAHLAGRAFIAGETRSYIDAYAFPMVRWAASALPDKLDAFPNIRAHHERLAADEAVKRALSAEGLAPAL